MLQPCLDDGIPQMLWTSKQRHLHRNISVRRSSRPDFASSLSIQGTVVRYCSSIAVRQAWLSIADRIIGAGRRQPGAWAGCFAKLRARSFSQMPALVISTDSKTKKNLINLYHKVKSQSWCVYCQMHQYEVGADIRIRHPQQEERSKRRSGPKEKVLFPSRQRLPTPRRLDTRPPGDS